MNPSELQSILESHAKWRRGEAGGARANLSYKNLSGATLDGATLSGATLSGANLSGANLSGANLSGATLYGATLDGATLSGANLDGANLSGATLSGATLYGATLYGANLSGANLSGANLSGANLYGANLSGANLYGANLYGANLSGRKVFGAYSTAGGIGERGRQLLVICAGERTEWLWRIGCFSGTEAELRTEIDRRHKKNEPNRRTCIRAVDYLIATAEDERNTPEGGCRTIIVEPKKPAAV